jgi:hypothetical protein
MKLRIAARGAAIGMAATVATVFVPCLRALAADSVIESSPGFSPKLFYPVDPQSPADAMHKTLSILSIAETQAGSSTINTDYVDGPTSNVAGKITHSRYKFTIAFKPIMDVFGGRLAMSRHRGRQDSRPEAGVASSARIEF